MRTLALLAVAAVALIGLPAQASAGPRISKVYGADGRRVAVIKETALGRSIYGANGRRVAVIRSR